MAPTNINYAPMPAVKTMRIAGQDVQMVDAQSLQNVFFQMWQNIFGLSGRGANGAQLQGPLNANGNVVMNATNSASPAAGELITKAYADANYGADAMRAQLGATSGNPLQTDFATPHVRKTLGYMGDGLDQSGIWWGRVIGVSLVNQTTTPSYTLNSVSSAGSSVNPSTVTLVASTWVELVSVNIVPNGGEVLLLARCNSNNAATEDVGILLQLQKDGVQIGTNYGPFHDPPNQPASGAFHDVDFSPGTVGVTYSLWANLQLPVSNPVTITSSTITALNVKV